MRNDPVVPELVVIGRQRRAAAAAKAAGVDEMDNLTMLYDPCHRLKSNELTLGELRLARAGEGRMGEEWGDRERWR